MADVKHCILSTIFSHLSLSNQNFTELLTEKLLRQVGWQGRVQNIRNSPHDVRSPDSRVLTQTFSPNFSLLAFGERWFLSLSWAGGTVLIVRTGIIRHLYETYILWYIKLKYKINYICVHILFLKFTVPRYQ